MWCGCVGMCVHGSILSKTKREMMEIWVPVWTDANLTGKSSKEPRDVQTSQAHSKIHTQR